MPAHLLGPHIVGERVVIRRVVPGETGPTGGPAFVDVLGVCTSWGEGTAVVVPESGVPVTIAIGDIVSGKPVPPRPSPRLRVSVREAELHTVAVRPGATVTPLGAWALRYEDRPEGRLLKRTNSCLAVGDPGVPIDEAAVGIVAFYTERGRRPLAQVEADSDVERALLGLGWRPLLRGEAAFQLTSVSRLARVLASSAPDIRGNWSFHSDISARTRELLPKPGEAAWNRTTMTEDGEEVGRGKAVSDGDWLGVYDLAVLPRHRRRGLAQAILAELVEWGAERGASTAWLHVETDNAPALALYEKLGFTGHHVCRYLEAPA